MEKYIRIHSSKSDGDRYGTMKRTKEGWRQQTPFSVVLQHIFKQLK